MWANIAANASPLASVQPTRRWSRSSARNTSRVLPNPPLPRRAGGWDSGTTSGRAGHEECADGGEHDEQPAPVRGPEQLAAQDRSEDRGRAVDQKQGDDQMCRRRPGAQVADDGARHGDAGRSGQALHEAQGDQGLDGRGDRTGQ